MLKQSRTMSRIVASFAALALAASLGLAGLAASAPVKAFADEPSNETTEKVDLSTIGLKNCGDQYALSGVSADGSVKSAMAFASVRDKDRNKLSAGTDYTVVYDWSGCDKTTGLGVAKATLTGMGKYEGTVTFEYNVVEYVLTMAGVADEVLSFDQTTLTNWMKEATDNTTSYYYQYARSNGQPTVYAVPAKSYLTIDTLLAKAGVAAGKEWKTFKAAASDGFSFTYTNDGATYNWYPAQAEGSSNTAGATPVPMIFTFQYVETTGATTAGALASDAQKTIDDGTADIQYVARTFIGATETDYKGGDLGGNRFPTNVSVFTFTGLTAFDNITDVPEDAWYTEYIAKAVNTGIMRGYGDGTKFGPTDTITRGDAILVLYRAANPNASTDYAVNDTPLTDNLSNQYYTAAINWAYKNEIAMGYNGTTTFGVKDNITRQDLATIFARYAQKVMGVDVAAAPGTVAQACKDWNTVASYAQTAIKWTAANDIMSGEQRTDGAYLNPTSHTSRAQMAKMILQTLAVGAE